MGRGARRTLLNLYGPWIPSRTPRKPVIPAKTPCRTASPGNTTPTSWAAPKRTLHAFRCDNWPLRRTVPRRQEPGGGAPGLSPPEPGRKAGARPGPTEPQARRPRTARLPARGARGDQGAPGSAPGLPGPPPPPSPRAGGCARLQGERGTAPRESGLWGSRAGAPRRLRTRAAPALPRSPDPTPCAAHLGPSRGFHWGLGRGPGHVLGVGPRARRGDEPGVTRPRRATPYRLPGHPSPRRGPALQPSRAASLGESRFGSGCSAGKTQLGRLLSKEEARLSGFALQHPHAAR